MNNLEKENELLKEKIKALIETLSNRERTIQLLQIVLNNIRALTHQGDSSIGVQQRLLGRKESDKFNNFLFVDSNSKVTRIYDIWSEGFSATGQSQEAQYWGSITASSFQEACDEFAKGSLEFRSSYNSERLTHWGCKLFDNEKDARKNYG